MVSYIFTFVVTEKVENLTGKNIWQIEQYVYLTIFLAAGVHANYVQIAFKTGYYSISYDFHRYCSLVMASCKSTSNSHGDSFEYYSYISSKNWDASIGEVINCSRELDNLHSNNAISVVLRASNCWPCLTSLIKRIFIVS